MATLLIQRDEPTDKDYEDGEDFLLEALEILERDPVARRSERRQALEGLRTLYGPEIWDEPEYLAEVETQIEILDAAPAQPNPKLELPYDPLKDHN